MYVVKKKKYLIPAGACLAVIVLFMYYYFISAFSAMPTTQYLYIDQDDNIDSVFAKLAPIASRHGMQGFSTLAKHGAYKDNIKTTHREYDTTKPKGYNIVAGKLSFEVNKVMSPNEIAPTLVAMDMQKLYVGDNGGLRRLTLREGLRLCGYPDTIRFNVSEKEGFDLLGNTVVVPVIKAVASRLLECINIK